MKLSYIHLSRRYGVAPHLIAPTITGPLSALGGASDDTYCD